MRLCSLIGLLLCSVARISANSCGFVIPMADRRRAAPEKLARIRQELGIDREQETEAAGGVSRLSTVDGNQTFGLPPPGQLRTEGDLGLRPTIGNNGW